MGWLTQLGSVLIFLKSETLLNLTLKELDSTSDLTAAFFSPAAVMILAAS